MAAIEIDLSPAQLLRWLAVESHRAGQHGFSLRASREWRVEPVGPGDGGGIDPEDELAAHVGYGTLELTGDGGGWRIVAEVVDDLGGSDAPDWPPLDETADGAEEVSLETFAQTFAIDGLDGTVTLEAADPAARRKAESLIARILADTHGS